MFLHKTNLFLQSFFPPGSIWQLPEKEKTIYLTFDDGPVPHITEWVLDLLAEHQIEVTFFCVGDNIRKHPLIFEKILRQNHTIANHTHNHLNGWKTPLADYLKNTHLCQVQLQQPPGWFRPPYGRITRQQAQALQAEGYQMVMWDVLSGDFEKSVSPQKCLAKTVQYTRNGSLVLFHDSRKAEKNLRFALPRYIAYCLDKGFRFEKL
jgi:peptidoglycan-N-acetylglucosamine deacetylase